MIFLNNAGTTRPYKEVIDLITEINTYYWENPSSNSSVGIEAKTIIEYARQQFADDLNCNESNLIFTSSGCESNSMAVAGFLQNQRGYNLYTSCLDHTSIEEIVNYRSWTNVGYVNIPVDSVGQINPDILRKLIIDQQKYSNRKSFVVITAASSEVGVIQDVKALTEVVHSYNGIVHCDAVQLFPERQLDVKDLGVDMLSISAQKFHAGRGCGVLYVKDGIELSPVIYGSQESSRRGGTYNTAAIAAAGKALEITRNSNRKTGIKAMRNKMLERLLTIHGASLNGPKTYCNRLENNISLTIDGVQADQLVSLSDMFGVIIAKGSACKSYEPTPSKALLGIGLTKEQALSTIRITLDEFNTDEEIIEASDTIYQLVARLRENN